MSTTDSLIPVCVGFCMSPQKTHEVLLVDENTATFADLAALFYSHVGPMIGEHYKPGGIERHITKAWVAWNQEATKHFPRETYFSDTNIKATLRLLAARRGIDMVYFWLNEIEEPKKEEEEEDPWAEQEEEQEEEEEDEEEKERNEDDDDDDEGTRH
ncbi:hypothetical protein BJY01DRAFT_246717 [Aspergillus pseudoustus]|uniref:Uncharacterized protein n=1 Tax=Aspergillus pseudoustus TaxID=1810923 RepID=A0ABR4K677_9EURO